MPKSRRMASLLLVVLAVWLAVPSMAAAQAKKKGAQLVEKVEQGYSLSYLLTFVMIGLGVGIASLPAGRKPRVELD